MAAAAVPTGVLDQAADPADQPAFEAAVVEKSLTADLPLLTAGLIVLLMVIFAVEKRLAFDIAGEQECPVSKNDPQYDRVIVVRNGIRIGDCKRIKHLDGRIAKLQHFPASDYLLRDSPSP